MKKLTNNGYVIRIADSLVNTYGNTLIENNLDLVMAGKLVKKLKPCLRFVESDKDTEYKLLQDYKKIRYSRYIKKEIGYEDYPDHLKEIIQ